MKQTLTCLLALLLLALPALAQTPDPLRQKLDAIFAHLDKSQVPTGRLAEYATPLIGLQHFNGTLADSALTDLDVLRHIYATALSSRLYGQDTLPAILTLNQRLAAAAPASASAPIAVAVLSLNYDQLRPDAETAGLVSIQNEQLFDVPGRSQSPYQTNVLFAAAPERSYVASPTVALVLRRNLYLSAGLPGTPTAYLDFADGLGYRPASWGQPLSTTYTTGGLKRIRVKLVYTRPGRFAGIDTRESWFMLHVAAPAAASRYVANLSYSPGAGLDTLFSSTTSYPPAATDYTHHLGAMVNVRYGNGHTSIVKPFIVVEGYNTATIAPHLTGLNNRNNTVEDFLTHTVLDPAPFDFNDNLEQAGYDLIYIDFNYGTDDIRRNAALFEEVLKWVNDQKQAAGSQEQNVVMGESMGGLVARYGLARLVRNGYNPQTRLLVLHDSPQRGANNPMGLQALTRMADFPVPLPPGNYAGNPSLIGHTTDLSTKLKEALRILEAPATKQLSIKSVTGIDYEYEDNSFIDGPYKDMVDFGGNPPAGFPPIIATSDGSQCGIPQNTPAYQELTRNDQNYLLGVKNFLDTGIQSEAIANALPAYGTQDRIAHLRVWFEIRVLWLRIAVNLLNRNYTSPAYTLPYETLPGGTTNLSEQQDLTDNYAHSFFPLWNFADNTTLYNGGICFVPTYSALDVETVTPSTAYASYINNVTTNSSPPRVGLYIAQENINGTQYNQAHIRFTARNSEWIYRQMENLPLPSTYCSTECTPNLLFQLAGPNIICAGTSATYTVQNLPAGARVSWSASGGLVSPATGTGTTFTVSPLPTAVDGLIYISAQITTACNVTYPSAALRVSVGQGYLTINDGLTGSQCAESEAEFSITDSQGAQGLYYTWQVSQGTIAGGQGTDHIYVSNLPFQRYSLVVSVSTPSVCGGPAPLQATYQRDYYTRSPDGSFCPQMRAAPPARQPAPAATLYPNPARETVDVHLGEADAAAPDAGPYTVRLFDHQGQLRAEQRSADARTVRLPTGQLPAGLYLVHILRGAQVLSRQQLEIAH